MQKSRFCRNFSRIFLAFSSIWRKLWGFHLELYSNSFPFTNELIYCLQCIFNLTKSIQFLFFTKFECLFWSMNIRNNFHNTLSCSYFDHFWPPNERKRKRKRELLMFRLSVRSTGFNLHMQPSSRSHSHVVNFSSFLFFVQHVDNSILTLTLAG